MKLLWTVSNLWSLPKRQAQHWGEIFCKGDCHPFPLKEKKNLPLISGPSSLFYSISYQFVWIWENLTYSFGACVKVCKVLGSIVLQRKVNPQTLLWRGLRSHLGSRLPSFPWHVLSVNFLVFLFHFDNAHVRDCVDFFNHLSQPYY